MHVAPLLERVARFDDLLEAALNEEQALIFETKSVIGRPMGSSEFLQKAEAILDEPSSRSDPAESRKRSRKMGNCY